MLMSISSFAQGTTSLVGTYHYVFSDHEGRPSKCDCDYRLEQVTIRADSSFEWMVQRGRLSPKQHFDKGFWQLERDSIVVLKIIAEKGTLGIGQDEELENWLPICRQERFIFRHFSLYSFGREIEFRK